MYNTALVGTYNRISNPDGMEVDIVDTAVLRGPFRNENPESYKDSRMYLKEMLSDAESVQFVLENLALQDPYTYGRTPETAAEVQNAKAEGSNQGAKNVVVGAWETVKGVGKALGNTISHPIESSKKAGNAIVETVEAIPEIPEKISGAYEDFTFEGYEDNLNILQGKGLQVAYDNAKGSTEKGIGIGLGGAGTLKAGTSALKILSLDASDAKNIPDVNADRSSDSSSDRDTPTAIPLLPQSNQNARQIIDPDSPEAWDGGSEKIYNDIRANSEGVARISQNTGFTESQIQRIKDHVFVQDHELNDGSIGRYDADPDIANAWNRLEQGDYTQIDIDLLDHEIRESLVEGIFKVPAQKAHEATVNKGFEWDPNK